jgi:AmiR/NasT family two-component response regulator
VIGALNLFGTQTGSMATADVRIVQALADVATIGLLQERAISRGEELTEQLQAALNHRVVIEQAKGVLAQIHAVGVDDAFDLLRSYARSRRRGLSEVARAVLEDPRSVPELTTRA